MVPNGRAIDAGDPFFLKLMLKIIIDFDDSALRSFIQSLQILQMKDVLDEYV